jgi:hypothetical protein
MQAPDHDFKEGNGISLPKIKMVYRFVKGFGMNYRNGEKRERESFI